MRDFVKEPTVEVVLAKKIPSQRDGYKHLRNPRMLHIGITAQNGTLIAAEVRASNRGFLAHELLLAHRPSSLVLDEDTASDLAAFISRRYLRDARPEAFDTRIAIAHSELATLLADEAERGIIFDVLFELKPLVTEPADDEAYEAKVVGVLKDKWDVAPRTQSVIEQMDALKDRLRGILLQCDGIIVDAVEVLGRSEITLRQRAHYARLRSCGRSSRATQATTTSSNSAPDESPHSQNAHPGASGLAGRGEGRASGTNLRRAATTYGAERGVAGGYGGAPALLAAPSAGLDRTFGDEPFTERLSRSAFASVNRSARATPQPHHLNRVPSRPRVAACALDRRDVVAFARRTLGREARPNGSPTVPPSPRSSAPSTPRVE